VYPYLVQKPFTITPPARAVARHVVLQHRPLMPMGPLCSDRPALAHIASFRASSRARSRDPLGVARVRSCTVREPLQRRLARVPLTRQRYASRASRVHTRACAFLLAPFPSRHAASIALRSSSRS
jgi:hypothetical protein